jgi:hypothetical protein
MKRRTLRIAALVLVAVAAVLHITLIAYTLWNFDPNVSCDRLLYWSEWFDCMHGRSHAYVWTIELALSSWIIAGVAMLAGRRLPPYVSVLVPGSIAILIGWFLTDYWRKTVVPYAPFAQTTIWDAFGFMTMAALLVIFLAGPAAGTWLLGLCRRYKLPEVATEFD